MHSAWREAWRAELPEVSRSQGRTLVVTLGLFWGSYALAVPSLEDGGIAVVPFFVGFAAGWWFYVVLMRVWGTRLFVWPGNRVERRKQTGAIVSLVRPSFVRRVFTATGWPPVVVGAVLVVLLALAILAGAETPKGSQRRSAQRSVPAHSAIHEKRVPSRLWMSGRKIRTTTGPATSDKAMSSAWTMAGSPSCR